MTALLSGCVSDEVEDEGLVVSYQKALSEQGPQKRLDSEDPSDPLGLLRPVQPVKRPIPEIQIVTDPNTGKKLAHLTIEQAITRALANSPEIRVVSFDPSIAKQEITKEAAQFDLTVFGRGNYEQNDNPVNSIYEPGQSDTRLLESGIKQKTTIGSEWSLSYALTRGWDDLFGRTLPTRYEPMLVFQLRQPLFRDAGQGVNLAPVDIARLDHRMALLSFRQKAEALSTEVITAYWRLAEARRHLEIQQRLLERTIVTLNKVEGRRQIDATDVQIKQAEAAVALREAAVLVAEREVFDAQDTLLRLMADPQINTLSELEILPVSPPVVSRASAVRRPVESLVPRPSSLVSRPSSLGTRWTMEDGGWTTGKMEDEGWTTGKMDELLRLALQNNPQVQQAKVAIEIADIKARVAENQKAPRLDLIGQARTQGLARGYENAHDRLNSGDFASYGVGLSLEYPLGNRKLQAELLRRKLERKKTVSTLQNIADKIATQAKVKLRAVETSLAEMKVQKQAVEAAKIHLRALEDSEAIRERLTPEFLLVKLQAQQILALAQRAEANAIAEFNISLAELAQTTGTVLALHQVRTSLRFLTVLSAGIGPDENNDSGV
ncbi:MAG: TolC family protein [Sedimentisphaerales bacterium]